MQNENILIIQFTTIPLKLWAKLLKITSTFLSVQLDKILGGTIQWWMRRAISGVATNPHLVGKFYQRSSFSAILGGCNPISGPIGGKISHEMCNSHPLKNFRSTYATAESMLHESRSQIYNTMHIQWWAINAESSHASSALILITSDCMFA